MAAREDASAAFRLLLEDLGRDRVARKDRGDQGITVYLKVIDQPSRDPAPVQASQCAQSVTGSAIGAAAATVDDLSAKPATPEQQSIEEKSQ